MAKPKKPSRPIKPLWLDDISDDGVDPFNLPNEEAAKYFQGKGLNPTWHYADMIGDAHDEAFTVAKMLDTELLQDVKDEVQKAIEEGETLQDFAKKLLPKMEQKGWIGWKETVDPATGEVVESELGTPRRIELIYRQNLATAYEVAREEFADEIKDELPLYRFVAVLDDRTREEHAKLDGVTLPVDDEFWDEFTPPLSWNCRCSRIQLDKEYSDELGGAKGRPKINYVDWENPRTGEVMSIPEGTSAGMGRRGSDRMAAMEAALKEREDELMEG